MWWRCRGKGEREERRKFSAAAADGEGQRGATGGVHAGQIDEALRQVRVEFGLGQPDE